MNSIPLFQQSMVNPSRNPDRPARWFFHLAALLFGLVMLIPAWPLLPKLLYPRDPLFLHALDLTFAPAFFLWTGFTGYVFP